MLEKLKSTRRMRNEGKCRHRSSRHESRRSLVLQSLFGETKLVARRRVDVLGSSGPACNQDHSDSNPRAAEDLRHSAILSSLSTFLQDSWPARTLLWAHIGLAIKSSTASVYGGAVAFGSLVVRG